MQFIQHNEPRVMHRHRVLRALCMTIGLLLLLTQLSAEEDKSAGSPPSAAVPAYRQANQVAVLTVHGEIDKVTLMSLERRMKQAIKDGADAIVLDNDTPGGDMYAALDICNLLKDRTETPANVVAWINPVAYSAGTIIALACREIIVVPGATLGDAAPIAIHPLLGLQGLPATERAKILAPLEAEVVDSARRQHYDENLVKSFIELGIELWMVENVITGEHVFVGRDEYRAVFGDDPPDNLASPSVRANPPTDKTVKPWIDQSVPDIAGLNKGGKTEAGIDLSIEPSLPPVRAPLTEADRGNWRLVMQVTDGTTLLVLKPNEALYYGIASAVVANDAELKAYFGAQTIQRYDATWSESLVRFLISIPVRAILIVIFLLALFIELAAPGFGVFGMTALVALLILIGAPALVGLAQWWDILLIVLGIALVFAELFVIPGFGVAGIAGVLCLLIGLVGTFVSDDLSTVQGQNELWAGLLTTLTSIFAAGVGIWLISRQVHSIPVLNRIILHSELRSPDEPGEPGRSGGILQAMGRPQIALQPGDTGTAETDLRPAGRANFRGRIVDVKSVGSYVDKGSSVRIVSVGRFVIEVEESTE